MRYAGLQVTRVPMGCCPCLRLHTLAPYLSTLPAFHAYLDRKWALGLCGPQDQRVWVMLVMLKGFYCASGPEIVQALCVGEKQV